LALDLSKAEMKLGHPRASLIEAVAHVDIDDAQHPLHLRYHDGGARGQRIDLVFGYSMYWSCSTWPDRGDLG
jgi:hypothetical protein